MRYPIPPPPSKQSIFESKLQRHNKKRDKLWRKIMIARANLPNLSVEDSVNYANEICDKYDSLFKPVL